MGCADRFARYREEVDSLLSQMYTRGKNYGLKDPSTDVGVHVAMLKVRGSEVIAEAPAVLAQHGTH